MGFTFALECAIECQSGHSAELKVSIRFYGFVRIADNEDAFAVVML